MSQSTNPQQYIPLRTIQAGGEGNQDLYPVVDRQGLPSWQPGDLNPITWEIHSVGWCHGAASNRKDEVGIKGQVFITGARVVVVSSSFAKGTRYRAVGGNAVIAAAALSKISDARAKRSDAGTVLAAQMRFPWIGNLAFGPPDCRTKGLRGEVRIGGMHVTAFGEQEGVILFLRLRQAGEVYSFVSALKERIVNDRLEWERITGDQRAALSKLPGPDRVEFEEGTLPLIRFAGSFLISPGSGSQGVISHRSFE